MKLDLAEGLKSGKKISPRDMQMIFIVIGLLVAVSVYFLVFTNYSTKKTEIVTQIEKQEEYLNKLKTYEANLQQYKSSVQDSKQNIAKNLKRLPVGLENEDFLLWLIRTDEKIGTESSAISFEEVDVPYEFSTYVGNNYIPVKGYKATITASMTSTYQQFKDYLKYVYDENEKFTFVESVSLTYDAQSSNIDVVFALSKFFINYEGGVYTPEPSFEIPLGNVNPFHSK